MTKLGTSPYLIVSTDAHAGPAADKFLRPYCPERYLPVFDDYCRAARRSSDEARSRLDAARSSRGPHETRRDLALDAVDRCVECAGHYDPHARLRDMDTSGVAAEVVFAGGQNFEDLPFMGKGWNAGPEGTPGEMRTLAGSIWDRWLADYVSAAPHRLLGVLQTSVWDVDAAVQEIEWGAEHGLHLVNLPASRRDFPPYTDPVYDRLWAAAAANGCVLMTHAGGGEEPLGISSRRGRFLHLSEHHWLGNRGLPQLIFGGVFHRHPGLKLVLAEQRVDFAPSLVRHLDSVYQSAVSAAWTDDGLHPAAVFLLEAPDLDDAPQSDDALPLPPSSYWKSNCYLSGSFLAPFEVALRHEVGIPNLMWGSDYPHCEGTWPYTRQALRHTFWDVPEDETRMILGENAVGLFGLDRRALAAVAARIGPLPEEIHQPLGESEVPRSKGGAFREFGAFA